MSTSIAVRGTILVFQAGSHIWSELPKKDRKRIKRKSKKTLKRSGKKAWKRLRK